MVSDEAIGSLLEVTDRPAGPRDIRRIFAGRDAPQTAWRETRQPPEEGRRVLGSVPAF